MAVLETDATAVEQDGTDPNTTISIRPSWYTWPGPNSGNSQFMKSQAPAQW